jgi:hypothetical protein
LDAKLWKLPIGSKFPEFFKKYSFERKIELFQNRTILEYDQKNPN